MYLCRIGSVFYLGPLTANFAEFLFFRGGNRVLKSQEGVETSRIQVLCLDGGGAKGLYSAELLARIEADHRIRVDEHFDLIVGTSTGALIACGLATGLRPQKLVQLYRDKGNSIFQHSLWRKCVRLLRAKHNQDRLRSALREVFGDKQLADCQRRLVIPAYWHDQDKPRLFKTPHSSRYLRDKTLPIREVAIASAAAPTYFAAVETVDNGILIDGGVFACNPVMIGLVEALTSLGGRLEDIAILSIGTTSPIIRYDRSRRKGGLFHWLTEGVRVCMRGQSICATNQVALLLGEDRFKRIDPEVADKQFELDRMNVQQFLSLAACDSLHQGKEIVDRFMSHIAPPFDAKALT